MDEHWLTDYMAGPDITPPEVGLNSEIDLGKMYSGMKHHMLIVCGDLGFISILLWICQVY